VDLEREAPATVDDFFIAVIGEAFELLLVEAVTGAGLALSAAAAAGLALAFVAAFALGLAACFGFAAGCTYIK
jgi:hypothetical protein